MAKYFAIFFAILVCMALVAPHAESADCDTVYQKVSPCQKALQGGAAVPTSCCDGIKSINDGATTTASRKSVCECLKKLANANNVKSETAAGVLKTCNVNLGIPISNDVDCNRVN